VGDVLLAAMTRSPKSPALRPAEKMILDSFSSKVRYRHLTALGFMPEARVKFIGELDRSPLHGMPAYQSPGQPDDKSQPNLLSIIGYRDQGAGSLAGLDRETYIAI
jgi:hypothetical protein